MSRIDMKSGDWLEPAIVVKNSILTITESFDQGARFRYVIICFIIFAGVAVSVVILAKGVFSGGPVKGLHWIVPSVICLISAPVVLRHYVPALLHPLGDTRVTRLSSAGASIEYLYAGQVGRVSEGPWKPGAGQIQISNIDTSSIKPSALLSRRIAVVVRFNFGTGDELYITTDKNGSEILTELRRIVPSNVIVKLEALEKHVKYFDRHVVVAVQPEG